MIRRKNAFLILIITVVLIVSGCKSYDDYVSDNLFNECKRSDEIIAFRVPPGLVKLFVTREYKELKDFLNGVDEIKIMISGDDYSFGEQEGLIKETIKELNKNDFKDLLTVHDGDEHVLMKMHGEAEIIDELFILFTDKDEFFALSLVGKMDVTALNTMMLYEDVLDLKKKDFNGFLK